MLRIVFIISQMFLVVSLFSEEIYSSIIEPTFADIYQPAPVTIKDMNYSQIYQNPSIVSPYQYSHYQYYYFQPYNYNMAPYPYMAYSGSGTNAPTYPIATGNKASKEANPSFNGARILHERAKVDQDAMQTVSANDLKKVWIASVGVTKVAPPISKNQVASIVVSKDTANALIIEEVKEKDANIEVLLKNESDRSFYQSDNEKKGLLSVAIFDRGNKSVKFIKPKDRNDKIESDSKTILPREFLFHSRFTWPINKEVNLTNLDKALSSGGRYLKAIHTKKDAERQLASFELDNTFLNKLDEINFDRESLYILGRPFRNNARANNLNTINFDKIEVIKLKDDSDVFHTVFFKEETKSIDEPSVRSVPDEDKGEVVLSGRFCIVDKPKNFYEGSKFVLIDQKVDAHVSSLE